MGKRETAQKRKGLAQRIRETPHLFAKLTVAWCVLFGTACSVYALRILSRTGHDATGLLGVILAFLGGELLFLCLRTVLREKQDKGDKPGKDTSYE